MSPPTQTTQRVPRRSSRPGEGGGGAAGTVVSASAGVSGGGAASASTGVWIQVCGDGSTGAASGAMVGASGASVADGAAATIVRGGVDAFLERCDPCLGFAQPVQRLAGENQRGKRDTKSKDLEHPASKDQKRFVRVEHSSSLEEENVI